MKKILVVTYYWPPSGGPGVQRVLKFCKYLPKYGWEPIILSVSDGDFPVLDESLRLEVENFLVFKTKPFSLHKIFNFFNKKKNTPTFQLSSSFNDSLFVKLSRWIRLNIIIPDGRVGWLPGAVKKGNDIIRQHKIKAILSTAPPYTAHLISKSLSLSNKIPWVADFRDPWTDRFYNYENNRSWVTKKLDKYLEESVIKTASRCITVSDGFAKNFNSTFKVIHNGYDENDFSAFIKNNFKNFAQKNRNVIISHLGTMTKSQNPINFFKVVSNLNSAHNIYKIDLIGSIHPDIISFLKKNNYHDFVSVKPYLNHREAIEKMCNSDFLLLVIPNTEKNNGIIPGKLFEYIRSSSKIVMIGPRESDAAKIIKNSDAGRSFHYDEKKSIHKYMISKSYPKTKNFNKFNRENLTHALSKILNDIT